MKIGSKGTKVQERGGGEISKRKSEGQASRTPSFRKKLLLLLLLLLLPEPLFLCVQGRERLLGGGRGGEKGRKGRVLVVNY